MPGTGPTRLEALSLLAPALLLAVAMTGCSSGSSPSAAAATTSTVSGGAAPTGVSTTTTKPSPTGATTSCSLVTEDEATAALGSPAGTGVATVSNGSSRCVYGNGALDVFLSSDSKAIFDQGHSALASAPAGTWSDLPDLGDAAFTSHGGPVVSVEALEGQTLVSVILSGSTAAGPTDAAVTLMHGAVARL
jgi:hypothetical protein